MGAHRPAFWLRSRTALTGAACGLTGGLLWSCLLRAPPGLLLGASVLAGIACALWARRMQAQPSTRASVGARIVQWLLGALAVVVVFTVLHLVEGP